MSIPEIKLTMLGVSGCGKTTLLHGMYAMLSAGVSGYLTYTHDPDVGNDLDAAWGALADRGVMPEPTSDQPAEYDFVFTNGIEPLVRINCVDFRGGAMTGRGGPDGP